jgi:hypothetical protein
MAQFSAKVGEYAMKNRTDEILRAMSNRESAVIINKSHYKTITMQQIKIKLIQNSLKK